jgi:hypothetical protein
MNLRELLLQFAGEEEKKIQEDEQNEKKRIIISDGFHLENLKDSIDAIIEDEQPKKNDL